MSCTESITLVIGQAGIQVGSAIWELLTAEHGISPDGSKATRLELDGGASCTDDSIYEKGKNFFFEGPRGNFIPRTCFVDLEQTVIDEIKIGSYRDLFSPSSLLNSIEDASSVFAKGYCSMGSQFVKPTLDCLRNLIEECDNCNNLLSVHAVGGGTGSGFNSLLFESVTDDYSKICKIECVVFPSDHISSNNLEPYNSLLACHYNMDKIDVSFMMDNESTYKMCSNLLEINNPTFPHINRICSQIFSSLTCSNRFGGIISSNLSAYLTNLVPYPRIHFPVVSFSPMVNKIKNEHENASLESITKAVFSNNNQLSCVDVEDPANAFVSACLMYRGDVKPGEAYFCVDKLKHLERLRFVDWCPTGVKFTLCKMPPTIIEKSMLAKTTRNVLLMSNTSAVVKPFKNLLRKYSVLYSKRAFVHWYVGEGMEEGEFLDSVEDIQTLIKDYGACFAPDEAEEVDDVQEEDKPEPKQEPDVDINFDDDDKEPTVDVE